MKKFFLALMTSLSLSTSVFAGNYSFDISDYTMSSWCYTDEDLILLAKLIDCEASDACTDEHKMWVGEVVLNRILSEQFPDTLKEVVYQTNPVQYICAATGKLDSCTPSSRSLKAAVRLLNGERVCDESVIFQSEFIQGEVVRVFETDFSTTYFCKQKG